MNISNVIHLNFRALKAPQRAAGARIIAAWRMFSRRLFAESVVGNPLHEAWTAGGEPLERITPSELAKSGAARHLVVPHSRSR